MRLVGGLKPQPGNKGFHTVLMAHTENYNYVMDLPDRLVTNGIEKVAASYLMEDYAYVRGWAPPEAQKGAKPSSVFIPITSFNNQAFHTYGNAGAITISALKNIVTRPLPYPSDLVPTSKIIAENSLFRLMRTNTAPENNQLLAQISRTMAIAPVKPPTL